jgi:alpha-L-arabinofuranosidase
MTSLRGFSTFLLLVFGSGGLAVSEEVATPVNKEYHVSVNGDDANEGSAPLPLKTISAAAHAAQPGDVITVHEGVYRELVSPPRGGQSDSKRIVYQAAAGETVEIKGSEIVTGWEKVQDDTWKAAVPNAVFGDFNPYAIEIAGDWFNPKGRPHHLGAVYLNGDWLLEAATRDEVMMPAGTVPEWLGRAGDEYLLNVAWLQPRGGGAGPRIPATAVAKKHGTQDAPSTEGGDCIGFILHGHWVVYEGLDFGEGADQLEIRAASASRGGIIEIRQDGPDGKLLGTCKVPNTGGWQEWQSFTPEIEPLRGVQTLALVFKSMRAQPEPQDITLWYAEVDADHTTIWAQFKDVDPNEELVEINVRPAVFYPEKPGMNYITVRGFTMRHAATQWAPPTAEQVGLLGTHWSKGWIIEDNDIAYSKCVGITLGKYGDEFDNTSADTAEGYVLTIERALDNGWAKDTIGGHIVRNNTISHCEQAGLVGSLGAAFSTISGNTIHDIHVHRLFTGAEMAGIKIHAAIDMEISDNRIYNTVLGIWLDWMAQGARVTSNLLYQNSTDLFVEVNHGPFVVDNNLFLSENALLDMSQGGAYAHNLYAGRVMLRPELGRETPYHPAHSTEVAGLHNIPGGDDRFYNNIFVGHNGLSEYDNAAQPVYMAGNVFLRGAAPSKHEETPRVVEVDPELNVVEEENALRLQISVDDTWRDHQGPLVTTDLLGRAKIPDLPYVNPDGTPLQIDTDYRGNKREAAQPAAGPFERLEPGKQTLKVWPEDEN